MHRQVSASRPCAAARAGGTCSFGTDVRSSTNADGCVDQLTFDNGCKPPANIYQQLKGEAFILGLLYASGGECYAIDSAPTVPDRWLPEHMRRQYDRHESLLDDHLGQCLLAARWVVGSSRIRARGNRLTSEKLPC